MMLAFSFFETIFAAETYYKLLAKYFSISELQVPSIVEFYVIQKSQLVDFEVLES